MTGGGTATVAIGLPESACSDCLRRSWLIGRLGPFIETACDDRPGRRTPELLRLGNEELLNAIVPARADEFLAWADSLDEGEMRTALERADCWAVCRHGDEFPPGLRDGADAPPALIGRGRGVPLGELAPDSCVTVVGARRATGYGLEVAANLARELAAGGLTVVSGMALGIDGSAHRGALEAGPTVAVLGCGPDRPYPSTHRRLYRRILEDGLILSEQPPGAEVRRWCFPARNRIMAALSGMTVVVEARRHSGSLITAEMASDAGREVGAVPGPVTARTSSGTNELIASGAAVVRGGQDVLDRMLGVGAVSKPLFGPDPGPGASRVLESIERGSQTVDAVAAETGRRAEDVTLDLTRLELMGYIRGTPAGIWQRTCLTAPYPPADHG
ncbi:MAG: DNA-processing protein DprA [Solirubrobacterales bacterium]|nr:DNA-processing protein DprA [Solirubrobacterales bacterium]